MAFTRGVLVIAAGLALAGGAAHSASYKTARKLYDDCAAPAKTAGGVTTAKRKQCAAFLDQSLSAWNLAQNSNVCSRNVGAELPDAYVAYWKKRGLGFLKGEFRSAQASVNDFLDSQKQPCPDRPR